MTRQPAPQHINTLMHHCWQVHLFIFGSFSLIWSDNDDPNPAMMPTTSSQPQLFPNDDSPETFKVTMTTLTPRIIAEVQKELHTIAMLLHWLQSNIPMVVLYYKTIVSYICLI